MWRWLCVWIFLWNSLYAHYMSFDEAYRQVLQSNDGLKSTQSAVQKQEKLDSAAKMIYLPQISLSAAYIRLNEPMNAHLFDASKLGNLGNLGTQLAPLLSHLAQPITLQDENITFGALNIIYPIFTGGKRHFANKLSEIALDDTKLALKLKEISLFEDCARLYYGVVLSSQILQTLQESSAGHYAHYQNAKKLQERGQIARIETLQAQVNYDKSLIDVQKASDNLKIAQMALNSLLNDDTNIQPTLVSRIEIKQDSLMQSMDYFVQKTLDFYPTLHIMENKAKSAKELSHIEFSSFLPEVGLFGSYIVRENNSLLEKAMPRWYVGVGARWSLLSPNGRLQKYQASKIASIESEYATAQAKKDLQTLCEKTYYETLSFRSQYFSLSSSIELAHEHLKLREKAFVQGMSTSAEVSDARNALSLALIEQQSVGYNYVIALSRLFALSNELEHFSQFLSQ